MTRMGLDLLVSATQVFEGPGELALGFDFKDLNLADLLPCASIIDVTN